MGKLNYQTPPDTENERERESLLQKAKKSGKGSKWTHKWGSTKGATVLMMCWRDLPKEQVKMASLPFPSLAAVFREGTQSLGRWCHATRRHSIRSVDNTHTHQIEQKTTYKDIDWRLSGPLTLVRAHSLTNYLKTEDSNNRRRLTLIDAQKKKGKKKKEW